MPLDSLAPHLPDPDYPFWWFSSTPLPDRRIPAGRAIEENPGTRLPPEADYWCHEGDEEWFQVDRTETPKPAAVKRQSRKRTHVLAGH